MKRGFALMFAVIAVAEVHLGAAKADDAPQPGRTAPASATQAVTASPTPTEMLGANPAGATSCVLGAPNYPACLDRGPSPIARLPPTDRTQGVDVRGMGIRPE